LLSFEKFTIMEPEFIFKICSIAVLPGWLLLIFLPKWKFSSVFVTSILIPGLLSLIYIYLIAVHFWGTNGGFGTLAQVALLFENKYIVLAGWVHYLAFDLFIGSWEVRDGQKLGIPHVLLVPCLILTFLFGPAGFFLYFIFRAAKKMTVN